jgi:hypothetical protein
MPFYLKILKLIYRNKCTHVFVKIWSPEAKTKQSHTIATAARLTVGKIIPVQSGGWLHPGDDTDYG